MPQESDFLRNSQCSLFVVLALTLILMGTAACGGGPSTPPAPISVSVTPKRAAIVVQQTLPLTVTITNDSAGKGVQWTATGGSVGSASGSSATYTAPAAAGVFTITATSVSDSSKSASLTIAVTDLAGVITYHNDRARDGVNSQEYALTTSTVASATFGKLFSCNVDGAIYAQPLWMPNLSIAGSPHNAIFVATQHESLYAFDADASPCSTLWHVKLIDSAHGGTIGEASVPSAAGGLIGSGYGDIGPEVGVTGTPVIDPATNTLYVVSKSTNPSGPAFYQRLHAIDLITGTEKLNGNKPVLISASISGNGDGSSSGIVSFDPRNQNQRPGLALVNGVVYIGWASHEDHDPYHGWIIGYNAATLSQASGAVFNTTPNAVTGFPYSRGGIWMGGGAPAADSNNNLYLITGNGSYDGITNFSDSLIKLSTTGGIAVADWFTPSDQSVLDTYDLDLGSGGSVVLVDLPTGSVKHLLVGGGKHGSGTDGMLFVLNRDAMGHFTNNDSGIVQKFALNSGIFATPAFWNNNLYIAAAGGSLTAFSFNPSTGKFNPSFTSLSRSSYGFPGATPSVSSSGTSNGIVWALDNSQFCTQQSPGCGPAVLHAYDASNLATELWNSSLSASDKAGNAVKFTVPTVANGKVYVDTRGNDTGSGTSSTPGELDVYGLKPN